MVRSALALSHAGLGGVLGDGLVGEDADPELAALLQVAADGHAARFDLAGRDPLGLERLEAELAEREADAALGRTLDAGMAVGLAILDALRASTCQRPPSGAGPGPGATRAADSMAISRGEPPLPSSPSAAAPWGLDEELLLEDPDLDADEAGVRHGLAVP